MTTYLVRPAKPADLKAVRKLARRVRRELHLAVRAQEQPGSAQGAELIWVVEAGRAEIVGCCGVREWESGAWQLHALYLAPEWRGFGLGRSLVEQAVRALQKAGALRLDCVVPGETPEALSLLRRLGFVEETAAGNKASRRLTRALGQIS
jgi:ribosomal protein S18 acetylase RimI-like enzyme